MDCFDGAHIYWDIKHASCVRSTEVSWPSRYGRSYIAVVYFTPESEEF